MDYTEPVTGFGFNFVIPEEYSQSYALPTILARTEDEKYLFEDEDVTALLLSHGFTELSAVCSGDASTGVMFWHVIATSTLNKGPKSPDPTAAELADLERFAATYPDNVDSEPLWIQTTMLS